MLIIGSGVAFMLQVAPLQVRLRALALAGSTGGHWDAQAYRRLSRRWEVWGVVATLMVVKPVW